MFSQPFSFFKFPKVGRLIVTSSLANLYSKAHIHNHIPAYSQHFKASGYFEQMFHCFLGPLEGLEFSPP